MDVFSAIYAVLQCYPYAINRKAGREMYQTTIRFLVDGLMYQAAVDNFLGNLVQLPDGRYFHLDRHIIIQSWERNGRIDLTQREAHPLIAERLVEGSEMTPGRLLAHDGVIYLVSGDDVYFHHIRGREDEARVLVVMPQDLVLPCIVLSNRPHPLYSYGETEPLVRAVEVPTVVFLHNGIFYRAPFEEGDDGIRYVSIGGRIMQLLHDRVGYYVWPLDAEEAWPT